MKGMVVDLETTGLEDPVDIVQLAFIIFDMETGTIVNKGTSKYFLPSRTDISPGAFCVSGISKEFLVGQTSETFEDYIPDFIKELDKVDYLVGHNLRYYDLRVLKKYGNEALLSALESKTIIDTMTDFMSKLCKVTCDADSTKWLRSYLKLVECYYELLRNGYTIDALDNEFKTIFDSSAGFHDATFDTFITYKTYLFVRGEELAK